MNLESAACEKGKPLLKLVIGRAARIHPGYFGSAFLVWVWLLVPAPLLTSCSSEPETPDAVVYTVRGRFLGLRFEGRAMRVEHEAIPGYMETMTMDFRLREPGEAAGLAVGDKIQFRYVVSGIDAFAEGVERLPPETELQLGEESAVEDETGSSGHEHPE